MKYLLRFAGMLMLLYLFGACNKSDSNTSSLWTNSKEMAELEVYYLDEMGITILWTAYKFTEKVGISGTFEDYAVYNDNVSNSIEGVLEKLKLSIPTECVDSGNAIRDFKLRTYFFQAFNTEIINGTIINAKGGEGIINLRMNNFSIDNPYTYVLRNDTIVIFTHLDLKKWKGEEALTTLNKECYELHKGKNGISKLWPDVNVEIKLPVKKHQ